MVTAIREFKLSEQVVTIGTTLPTDQWEGLSRRTRDVLVRGRYVVDATASPEQVSGVRHRPLVAVDGLTCWCGYAAQSKSALGGHKRGHSKRGESPQEH